MRKGQRTRGRNKCACGCGKLAPVIFRGGSSPRAGHVSRYATFIPGHGNKDWGRRMKELPLGALDRLPTGSTRLHYSNPHLAYRQVKVGPGAKGWRFEHRVVMARKLGRTLRRNEIVHHINYNTLDNRPGNLAILSHVAHSRLHNTLTRWSKTYAACKECSTTEREHEGHGLCTACYQRQLYVKEGRRAYLLVLRPLNVGRRNP